MRASVRLFLPGLLVSVLFWSHEAAAQSHFFGNGVCTGPGSPLGPGPWGPDTCQLQESIAGTVQLDGEVDLDCNGHAIFTLPQDVGVFVADGATNVILRNCTVVGGLYGLQVGVGVGLLVVHDNDFRVMDSNAVSDWISEHGMVGVETDSYFEENVVLAAPRPYDMVFQHNTVDGSSLSELGWSYLSSATTTREGFLETEDSMFHSGWAVVVAGGVGPLRVFHNEIRAAQALLVGDDRDDLGVRYPAFIEGNRIVDAAAGIIIDVDLAVLHRNRIEATDDPLGLDPGFGIESHRGEIDYIGNTVVGFEYGVNSLAGGGGDFARNRLMENPIALVHDGAQQLQTYLNDFWATGITAVVAGINLTYWDTRPTSATFEVGNYYGVTCGAYWQCVEGDGCQPLDIENEFTFAPFEPGPAFPYPVAAAAEWFWDGVDLRAPQYDSMPDHWAAAALCEAMTFWQDAQNNYFAGWDLDGDGIIYADNCASDFNPFQSDLDNDDRGDVCDLCPELAVDLDGDGFGNEVDCLGDDLETDCADSDPNTFYDCLPSCVADGDADPATLTCGADCQDVDGDLRVTACELSLRWRDDCDDSDEECTDVCLDDNDDNTLDCSQCGTHPWVCAPTDPNDFDSDGSPAGTDCDDQDPNMYVNCGQNCGPFPCCTDNDGDGFLWGCDSWYTVQEDCSDTNSAINPGQMEPLVCNQVDENCDGFADNVVKDGDADGWTAWVCGGGADCNDNNSAVRPDASETCDSLDNDCDGAVDEGSWVDVDGDGARVHIGICGGILEAEDCDDTDPSIGGANLELCDGKDNDCDGRVDETDLCEIAPEICCKGTPAECAAAAAIVPPELIVSCIECAVAADADHDGHVALACPGGDDCSDLDSDNWAQCETCRDNDGDGWYVGCDRYRYLTGPDCDDDDVQERFDCGGPLDSYNQPPIVAITPTGGAVVDSPFDLLVTLSDSDGIAEVHVYEADEEITSQLASAAGSLMGLRGPPPGPVRYVARVVDGVGNMTTVTSNLQVGQPITVDPEDVPAPGEFVEVEQPADSPEDVRNPSVSLVTIENDIQSALAGPRFETPSPSRPGAESELPYDFHYQNHHLFVGGAQQATVSAIDFFAAGPGGLDFRLERVYSSDAERQRRIEAREATLLRGVYEHLSTQQAFVEQQLLTIVLPDPAGVATMVHNNHREFCGAATSIQCDLVGPIPFVGWVVSAVCFGAFLSGVDLCMESADDRLYGIAPSDADSLDEYLDLYLEPEFWTPSGQEECREGFSSHGLPIFPLPHDVGCIPRIPPDFFNVAIRYYRPHYAVQPYDPECEDSGQCDLGFECMGGECRRDCAEPGDCLVEGVPVGFCTVGECLWGCNTDADCGGGRECDVLEGVCRPPNYYNSTFPKKYEPGSARYSPVAAALWAEDVVDVARSFAGNEAERHFSLIGPMIAARLQELEAARTEPIRLGLGEGWSLNLPYLEIPDPVTGRPGYLHWNGTAAEYANPQAAIFSGQQSVLWAVDPANTNVPVEPNGAACDPAADDGVSRQCVLDSFDETYMVAGVPSIDGVPRPDAVYRLTQKNRIFYFNDVGQPVLVTNPAHGFAIEIFWAATYSNNVDALQNGRIDHIIDASGNTYAFTYYQPADYAAARAAMPMGAELDIPWPGTTGLTDPPLIKSISSGGKTIEFTYAVAPPMSGVITAIPVPEGDLNWVLSGVHIVGDDTVSPGIADADLSYAYEYANTAVFRCEGVERGDSTPYCGLPLSSGPLPLLDTVYSTVLTAVVSPNGGREELTYNFEQESFASASEFERGIVGDFPVYDLAPQAGIRPAEYNVPCAQIECAEPQIQGCENRGLYRRLRGPEVRERTRSSTTTIGGVETWTYENNHQGRTPAAYLAPLINECERDDEAELPEVCYDEINGGVIRSSCARQTATGWVPTRTQVVDAYAQEALTETYTFEGTKLVERAGCLNPTGCDLDRIETYAYPVSSGAAKPFSLPTSITVTDPGGERSVLYLEHRADYPWLLTRRYGDVLELMIRYGDESGTGPYGAFDVADPGGSYRPVAMMRWLAEEARWVTDYSRYDEAGLLLERRAPDGVNHAYSYVDAVHGALAVEDALPAGHLVEKAGTSESETYQTDTYGRLVSITDPRGFSWDYTYDSVGRLAATSDAGFDTTYVYSPTQTTVSFTPAGGGTATVARRLRADTFGRLAERDDVRDDPNEVPNSGALLAQTRRVRYDAMGRLAHVAMTNGVDEHLTAIEQDGLNRVVGVFSPGGGSVLYTYDDRLIPRAALGGEVATSTTTVTLDGGTIEYFDSLRRAVGREVFLGGSTRIWRLTYDRRGRLTMTTEPDGAHIFDGEELVAAARHQAFEYDSLDRLQVVVEAVGPSWTRTAMLACDVNDDVATDDDCAKTSRDYDDMGRLTFETDVRGNIWSFGYDALGRADWAKDPLLNQTDLDTDESGAVTSSCRSAACETYERDHLGRVTAATLGSNRFEADFTFFGEVAAQRDITAGTERRAYYAPQGRPARRVDELANVWTWSYDWRGTPVSHDRPAGAVAQLTYTPDAQGNVHEIKGVRVAGGAVEVLETRTYDGYGRVVTRVFGDGRTYSYARDALGRLSSVSRLGVGGDVTYERTPSGAIARVIQGGVATGMGLGLAGRPTTAYIGDPADPLDVWRFTYDRAGNERSRTNPLGGVDTFTYDTAGRLVGEDLGDYGVWAYDYDETTRRITVTDPFLNEILVERDSRWRIAEILDQESVRTAFTYNSRSQAVLLEHGELGGSYYTAESVYDDAGRLRQTWLGTDLNRLRQSNVVYSGEHVSRVEDALGLGTSYEYLSALSAPTATVSSVGGRTEMNWLASQRIASVTEHAGTADARTHTFSYNDLGGSVAESRAGIGTFQYVRDEGDRLLYMTPPSNEVAQVFHYDAAGRVSTVVDEQNRSVRYLRNGLGQITNTMVGTWNGSQPINEATQGESRTYRASGLLGGTVTTQGTTWYEYWDDGALHLVDPPGSNDLDTYTYSDNRILTGVSSSAEPKSGLITTLVSTLSYDYGGLLTGIDQQGTVEPLVGSSEVIDEVLEFIRDPYGRVRAEIRNADLSSASDVAYLDNGLVSRIDNVHYDRSATTGLVEAIRIAARGGDYSTYLPGGPALTPDASYPDLSLEHNADGVLKKLSRSGVPLYERGFTAAGLVDWVDNGNRRYDVGHDSDAQVTSIVERPTGSMVTELERIDYEYAGGRLEVFRDTTTSMAERYLYDALGNLERIEDPDTAVAIETRTINTSNQLAALTRGAITETLSYDARGNIRQIDDGSEVTELLHDGLGNLRQTAVDGVESYRGTFDAMGRLVTSASGGSVRNLRYLQGWVVSFLQESTTRRLVPDLGAARPLAAFDAGVHHVPTWVGTTAPATASSGGGVEARAFSPYGKMVAGSDDVVPFAYKGYLAIDGADRHWAWARTYDAARVSFTGPDALDGDPASPVTTNRYRAFSAEPVAVVDWYGLADRRVCDDDDVCLRPRGSGWGSSSGRDEGSSYSMLPEALAGALVGLAGIGNIYRSTTGGGGSAGAGAGMIAQVGVQIGAHALYGALFNFDPVVPGSWGSDIVLTDLGEVGAPAGSATNQEPFPMIESSAQMWEFSSYLSPEVPGEQLTELCEEELGWSNEGCRAILEDLEWVSPIPLFEEPQFYENMPPSIPHLGGGAFKVQKGAKSFWEKGPGWFDKIKSWVKGLFGKGKPPSNVPEKMLKAFERQLEQHGAESLQSSLKTIEKNLLEHRAKLEAIREAGGYTSSVEREISTFEKQVDALRYLLRE